jgi:hypothetical protein
MTITELYKKLGNMVKHGLGDESVKISIPFRDGIGIHYEDIVNVTTHDGIVDIHTTVSEYDDVKK